MRSARGSIDNAGIFNVKLAAAMELALESPIGANDSY